MNLKEFADLWNDAPDPYEVGADGYALLIDAAEGALRVGVRFTLAEYAAMTPELRRAFVLASNRIDRDRAGLASIGEDATVKAISDALDSLEAPE